MTGSVPLLQAFVMRTPLEADPLQLVATVIQEKEQYDLRTLYTLKKGNNINTVNLLFKL